ncbi:AbrB/MazE/SpoVT family DNA-binding domain-containing protein [Kushneria aurantia]|uniref:Antitoxin n=1 Tax=Kushneria aurantia TaxID=504092 RepID=A0ABV6G2A3_9GAMM|nr:hypothetical protein [Kushneria aurantia]
MSMTRLRRVGGSVMLSVSPALLRQMNLDAGGSVEMTVDQGRLIVEPARPRYSLEELLAECGASARADDEQQWLDDQPVGREEL